ncbi:MAG: YHS domain-containing (seleno)protein [Pseudomonadota bacterium]
MMKALILAFGVVLALVASPATGPALAFDEASTAPVNVDETGLGLRGYDPVAYFVENAPVEGKADLTASHADVTYRFASESNRALFLANPAQYAPHYGGFCQMGAALGKKLDGDPLVWRVADGKLFVYAYPAALEGFMKDVPGNTEKADANWPEIKDIAPKDL